MRVAIVGANGQLGTELCFLLREAGETVVPVVRNELGTHFLTHHDFECRVRDVSDATEADEALSDADAVIVAAFAWQFSREGFRSRGARKTNEHLVRNAVRCSPTPAPVIYFSSQAALGSDLNAPTYSDWSLYTREKRNAERRLFEHCEETGTDGYALRLGFVHGWNQRTTAELQSRLAQAPALRLAADPDQPSNVLHTVTLRDAVLRCAHGRDPPGTYSVVNRPQWTWEEVIDHYRPEGVEIEFVPPAGNGGLTASILGRAWQFIETYEGTLRTATLFVPDRVNQRLFNEYLKVQRDGEIDELGSRVLVESDDFLFDPVPGPFLADLPETRPQLSETSVDEVFEREGAGARPSGGSTLSYDRF